MFETLIGSLKSRALNRRDDFDTFDEYIAHSAASRTSTNSPAFGGFLCRLRHMKIGRGGYDSVDTVDADGRWVQMLPRVYAAKCNSSSDTNKTRRTSHRSSAENDLASAWQPVALNAHRHEADTVLDRFVRIGQVDRSVRVVIDERRMERFYVIEIDAQPAGLFNLN